MSEANETETKVVVPAQTQYVKAKNETLTDLASFSTFVVLTLSNGQEVSTQINFRHGLNEQGFLDDFRQWYRMLDTIAQDGGDKPYAHFWNGAQAKPAQPANPDLPAAPALPSANGNGKKARRWDEPVPQAELPAELAEVTVDVFTQEFDLIKVLPQPDEKTSVEFWKDSLKFPVGAKINKAKYDTVEQYLDGLTEKPIDPSKAGEYRIAGIQYWTQGAEYEYQGQKKHYKNICLLKPAL